MVVHDQDEMLVTEKEFTMVTDPHEWRYWVTAEKCPRPASYEIVTKTNDVFLKPNE